ncbi:MAG TPA: hypothetical protein PKH07_06530, partial [bacterium]|nr:hypothetical protein [bacterium]
MHRISVVVLWLILQCCLCQAQVIIDHRCTDASQIPEAWILQAKEDLHIAYQHTSHGSQLTTGIEILNGRNPGGLFAFEEGGGEGLLDYRDYAMQSYAEPPTDYMDLGQPTL